MTTYLLKGLNIDKFLKDCQEKNILLSSCHRLSYNTLKISVLDTHLPLFIKLAQKYNYEITELRLSPNKKFLRFVKTNLVFVLVAALVLLSIPIFSNFVYKTQIYGLTYISQREITSVLDKNGYTMGKRKAEYNTEKISKILQEEIENISFCSAIIKGNTLILNIHERIDTSDDFYDYKPIFSPIDCVIENINLLSGTPIKKVGDVALKDTEIVLPKTILNTQTISVPAKAVITAKITPSATFFVENGANFDNLLEENKKVLYNMLLNLNILGNIDEKVSRTQTEKGESVTLSLHAKISF